MVVAPSQLVVLSLLSPLGGLSWADCLFAEPQPVLVQYPVMATCASRCHFPLRRKIHQQ